MYLLSCQIISNLDWVQEYFDDLEMFSEEG